MHNSDVQSSNEMGVSINAIPLKRIKQMIIKGFKKFSDFSVVFNPQMNILVGENEAGKSTIIDALRLVFCQLYRNTDKSILLDFFNRDQVKRFEASPTIENLPYIHIEIVLEIPDKSKDSQLFLGENHFPEFGNGALYGIRFECKFDQDEGAGLDSEISAGHIPVEYYKLEWRTFAEQPFYLVHPPLSFLAIDTSIREANNPFSRYARDLFVSRVIENMRLKHKHDFRIGLKELIDKLNLPELSDTQKFGISDKRILLENVLTVLDDEVALDNKGSGVESIVKIQLALSKRNCCADVITIEEPENHLSYSNLRKLLNDIQRQNSTSQLIIATHSNMIVSRLDVRNVLWISDEVPQIQALSNVAESTARFFSKLDNSNLLDLLLAEKVILVEGPTEFLLVPKFYKEELDKTIESDNVTVISCNGISFLHYLAIAETRQKRVAVLTDNDKNADRVKRAKEYNATHVNTHIFMANDIEQWTWEKCLFELNTDYFKENLSPQKGASYLFHEHDYGQHLGYMLNHKVDVAFKLLEDNPTLVIPQYVREAFQWLNA